MIDIQKNLNTRDVSAKVKAAAAKLDSSAKEIKPSGNPAMSATGMDGHGVKQAIGG